MIILVIKAVGLLSGGLDSRLAVKVMIDQGIEVFALHNVTIFCTCTSKNSCKYEALKAAEEYNIDLKTINTTKEFLQIIENPRFGYGRNMNPCLDCRVHLFIKAEEYMKELGAKFIFTGEVLGERPMSQRKEAMKLIEKETGLSGLILRPLSARLLEPTIPEIKGWVDRQRLLDISGRSRKPQIKLAKKYNLKDYPCPAGGCLLTDKMFAGKLKDLIDNEIKLNLEEIKLLKLGRHFRLSQNCRFIVGRDETENTHIEKLANGNDWLVGACDYKGPIGLLRGEINDMNKELAAKITAIYGQGRDNTNLKIYLTNSQNIREIINVQLDIDIDFLDSYRIS